MTMNNDGIPMRRRANTSKAKREEKLEVETSYQLAPETMTVEKGTPNAIATTHVYIFTWCIHFLLPVMDITMFGPGHGAYDARPLCLWDFYAILPLVCSTLMVYILLLTTSDKNKRSGLERVSVMLALVAHLADLAVRFDRMPLLWDHEYWAMQTEVSFIISYAPWLFQRSTSELWFLSLFRLQFGLLYAAAAFWKLNTSFFDHHTSCATLLLLEFIGAYLPFELTAGSLRMLGKIAPYVTVIGEASIACCLLRFAIKSHTEHRVYDYRYRDVGVLLAVGFHTVIFLLPVNSAGGFSLDCVTRFICYFDSDETVLFLNKIRSGHGMRWTLGSLMLGVSGGLAFLRFKATGAGPDVGFLAYGLMVVFYALLVQSRFLDKCTSLQYLTKLPHSKMLLVVKMAVIALTVSYGFVFPVLGLQQMGASTMYGNLRNYGPSNHYIVPTAILGDDLLFGGGLVQILSSTSDTLNLRYGYIQSAEVFPDRVLRWVSEARGLSHPPRPMDLPVQLFPYCMGIHHSRQQLMESYTSLRYLDKEDLFVPYVLPISAVSQMLHQATTSNEDFVVRLANAGTSDRVDTARTRNIIVLRPSSCEVVRDGHGGGDCAKDATAVLIKQPHAGDGRGLLRGLVSKLLMPYPQPVHSGIEEVCIT